MANDKLIGQVDQAQIAKWKEEYGKIFGITADEHICYVKKPGRTEMGQAAVLGSSDPIAYKEALLNACWLGGSEEIRSNDKLFFGVSGTIDGILEIAHSEIKNL